MNKQTAEKLMNKWGDRKIPFLFVIDFNTEEIELIKLSDLQNNSIKHSINNSLADIKKPSKPITFESFPMAFSEYKRMFDGVLEEIKNGNSYLLNLTAKTPIKTNLSLLQIYEYSRATYKLYFKDKFVVFSPETFVKTKQGKMYSYPMKGTIDASLPNAEKIIINDKKEAAEHATITDLIRNDLSMICTDVKVEKYRYIDKIQTNKSQLLQVSSEISGCLPNNYQKNIGSLIFKLLPAGSISGAPKEKTVEIIKTFENYERGFYTGIFGVFDGTDIDSAVMIRFIEKEQDKMYFKSGGGITVNSSAISEYEEMIKKIYLSF